MGKVTTPSSVNENKALDSVLSLNDIITNISFGDYALVLGPEVILKDTSEGDVESVLLKETIEKIVKEKRGGVPAGVTIQTFSDLTEYVQRITVKNALLDVIDCDNKEGYWKFELEDVNPSLIALLQSGFFQTIVTTSFDHYVEEVLREKWHDDLMVVDMCNYTDKESKQENNAPTLYYAFGKADPKSRENSDFVLSDYDRVRIAKEIMMKGNLLRTLNRNNFLAIGCDFDDWLFRFFWYTITAGGDKVQNMYSGTRNKVVRRFDAQSTSDFQLKKYLDGLHVLIPNANDPRKFIQDIQEQLEVAAKSLLMSENKKKHPDIFISYAHEDLAMAMHLYKVLKGKFNIWMDIRMEVEGTTEGYNADIDTALSESKIFITILSKEVRRRLEEGETAYGYLIGEEWKKMRQYLTTNDEAAENIKIIFPIALTGYDERMKYHEIYNVLLPNHSTVHRMDATNTCNLPIENIIAALENQLIQLNSKK